MKKMKISKKRQRRPHLPYFSCDGGLHGSFPCGSIYGRADGDDRQGAGGKTQYFDPRERNGGDEIGTSARTAARTACGNGTAGRIGCKAGRRDPAV